MEDTIIVTSENPTTLSSSSQFNSAASSSRVICRVCQKQFSQYTCPRCNTRYCSLHCYKSHGLRCTESFMRENVLEELKQLRPDDGSKKKMLEILKRHHAEGEENNMDEDDDEDDEPSLSKETIQKVLSGEEINFDDLTEEEKKLLQRAIDSGELSKMIEPWEPWWLRPSARNVTLSHGGTRLVQPIETEEKSCTEPDDFKSQPSEVPAGPETPLKPLKKLTSAEPSPLLSIHLVDIMYSYCFTLRLYNGDWQSDAGGASMVVLGVSSILGQGALPETMLEATSSCLEQTCSPAFKNAGGLQFGFGILDDISTLISLGGAALVCALSDLQRLIQAGERDLKFEKPKNVKSSEIRSKLKAAEGKIYFMMCWAHEQPAQFWSALSVLVKAEKASAEEYRRKNKASLKTGEAPNQSKALIEEV